MRKLLMAAGAFTLAAGTLGSVTNAYAADHLDAPAVKTDGRTDINDVYAFRSPTDHAKTVLIMTVNPLAGTQNGTTFHPDAKYQFVVDNDGDAESDGYIDFTFGSPRSSGRQSVEVDFDVKRDRDGEGRTDRTLELGSSGRAWAGLADDPFFFDLQAFKDQVVGEGGSRTFCDGQATNFFHGLNTNAIAVEVPSKWLGGPKIGVWGRTRVDGSTVDRMGRPAINTVFIPSDQKDAFNATKPHRDRSRWEPTVVAKLKALSGLDGSGYDTATATQIAELLLPDVLTLDTSSGKGFGDLNGRRLADDVIDTELTIVTGGIGGGSPVLTSDCVANDSAFRSAFPYLAAKN